MIAAGLGCGSGCSLEDILEALGRALACSKRDLAEVVALYSAHFKASEDALRAAAERLARPLVLLSSAELEARAPLAATRSARVQARFGLPSIAETAALAGAASLAPGASPRLLCARQIAGKATCALAASFSP